MAVVVVGCVQYEYYVLEYCAPPPRERKKEKKLNPRLSFRKKSTVIGIGISLRDYYLVLLSCSRPCLAEVVWLAGDSGIVR